MFTVCQAQPFGGLPVHAYRCTSVFAKTSKNKVKPSNAPSLSLACRNICLFHVHGASLRAKVTAQHIA